MAERKFAMKAKKFENMLGGAQFGHLTPDAARGLNTLGHKINVNSAEDELFESAIRRANEDQLRKLARFRLDSSASSHME